MKCPHCKDPNLVLSERKGIEIDYCPDCRGIWLDRGELDKILEKSAGEYASEERGSYKRDSDDDDDRHQKHYKRRKSFLHELFD